MDDVLVNKAAVIQRCIVRINEEYAGDPVELRRNFTKQDSVLLNLQRACEACIDMANRLIRQKQLGIPQSARDSFTLLAQSQLISNESAKQMQRMVGLRNIAVHDYQALNLDIVISVLDKHLDDFRQFSAAILVHQAPE